MSDIWAYDKDSSNFAVLAAITLIAHFRSVLCLLQWA